MDSKAVTTPYEWFGCHRCSLVWIGGEAPQSSFQISKMFKENANCPCCNSMTAHYSSLPDRPFTTAFSGNIHELALRLQLQRNAA